MSLSLNPPSTRDFAASMKAPGKAFASILGGEHQGTLSPTIKTPLNGSFHCTDKIQPWKEIQHKDIFIQTILRGIKRKIISQYEAQRKYDKISCKSKNKLKGHASCSVPFCIYLCIVTLAFQYSYSNSVL